METLRECDGKHLIGKRDDRRVEYLQRVLNLGQQPLAEFEFDPEPSTARPSHFDHRSIRWVAKEACFAECGARLAKFR